ncbi:gem-associated protein 8 [Copidosoma floridanum]|uniref:gem-associated protein 8 n=1 Tax=Copidosoma floridanum TaxID=29053 RepID=UPI0006C9A178|nr:gem-associated protein 8 [Copidosoma floridanum]
MEFINCGKRNRKRRRKRRLNSKQSHQKFEVKSEKRQKISKNSKHYSTYATKEKLKNNTMDANAFWENYSAAHEWQKRHNVTWWKTRCYALEHENRVLKETIRNLMQSSNSKSHSVFETNQHEQFHEDNLDEEEETCTDENLEFHVNEDMMTFLTQSIRHKIELKTQKESELSDQESKDDDQQAEENIFEKTRKRSEIAKLMYGEASTKILAMEAALQATLDRHMEKSKPQYWPNIPLKL